MGQTVCLRIVAKTAWLIVFYKVQLINVYFQWIETFWLLQQWLD